MRRSLITFSVLLVATLIVGGVSVQVASNDGGQPSDAASENTVTLSKDLTARLRARGRDSGPAPARSGRVDVSDGLLRETVERLRRGKSAPSGVDVEGRRVRVEVVHSLPQARIRGILGGLGGIRIRRASRRMVDAFVPFNRLSALEHTSGVAYVRVPVRLVPPSRSSSPIRPSSAHRSQAVVVGEEVAKTNAAVWHALGRTGQGVKVGIIDSFSGTRWARAQAQGEVPAPAAAICYRDGVGCGVDFWNGGDHGIGVAEVIHEMAPGATLYLASVCCAASDFQYAVDWFASQGVRIISRSQTSEYDGPGNGTMGIADVIQSAVNKGILWLNSAGNSAGGTSTDTYEGSYWRGSWTDADNDRWLDFAPGDDHLGFLCDSRGMMLNGLRWSDWGAPASRTNYDLYIYDEATSPVDAYEYRATGDQVGGQPPIERTTGLVAQACDAPNDIDYLRVWRYTNDVGSTAGDVLEIMGNLTLFERWNNPYSAGGPAADTASPGGIAIGAVDPVAETTVAGYSSRGPTNDGRMKPDLSAPACMRGFTYSPGENTRACFNGTSAATPVVAGAAALVLGTSPGMTPAQLKAYLMAAVHDRGAPGSDNDYGVGELVLPVAAAPDTTPPADPVVSSPSHRVGVPSRNRVIQFRWSGAADDRSGVDGFSYSIDGQPATLPDAAKDAEENIVGVDTRPLPNGRYYFHLRTVDNAGNWTSTRHLGPLIIAVPRGGTGVRCVVPNVRGKTLRQARRMLSGRRCALGRVTRAWSARVRRGRIVRQSRRPGARLARGARVNVVISRGGRRR